MTDHIMIPDTQIKPGVKTDHLQWAGNYIKEHKPEKIIIIGDWWDMHSLSSYAERLEAEGQRYREDIEVGMDALSVFMGNVPKGTEVHFCEGNHEDRINRKIAKYPELAGAIDISDCNVEQFGIKRHKFLKPVKIDGVSYCHYFYNANSGRPFTNARLMTKATHFSATAGHLQTLDAYMDHIPHSTRFVRGLIAGAFYLHDEDYKGPQANNHWRGIIHKRHVQGGMYDLNEISLHTLRREWH